MFGDYEHKFLVSLFLNFLKITNFKNLQICYSSNCSKFRPNWFSRYGAACMNQTFLQLY